MKKVNVLQHGALSICSIDGKFLRNNFGQTNANSIDEIFNSFNKRDIAEKIKLQLKIFS